MQSFLVPMHEIDTNLYLGSLMAANNFGILSNAGISTLVSALSKDTPLTKHPSIKYYSISIDDTPSSNIAQHVPEAIRFIDSELKQGKKVLIHCAAGISRSTSIAVAYFMAKYNMNFDEALNKVKGKRGCAYPNQGFESQLRRLDQRYLRQCLSS